MSGRDDKALRYIASLDSARSNGSWNELSELIRKVKKHAPQRTALIDIAVAEHDVANFVSAAVRKNASSDNSSALSPSQFTNLGNIAQSREQRLEERIQAESCLLWSRWADKHGGDLIAEHLSDTNAGTISSDSSIWTKICLVKSACLRGLSLVRAGRAHDGLAAYQSILPWLDINRNIVLSTPQLLFWSQEVLGQIAVIAAREDTGFQMKSDGTILRAFRQWAILSSRSKETSGQSYGYNGTGVSRLSMWKAYYKHISALLQNGGIPQEFSRSEQATELRRVETSYENELLRNTRFPKATETNTTIEEWVEQAIRNWELLCGPQWSDEDLGQGGRNSVGRNMLDILYRAAMKTFHSTLILRRLFQVHKSLSEFDLAYKALDTYIELMERGRARAKKAKELPLGQDSDETFMKTISEGVEGLCSFGRQAEAERAYDLSLKLEILLSETESDNFTRSNNANEINDEAVAKNAQFHDHLPTRTIATVRRALGIGSAHWAKWTPFNERRSALQADAINHLSKAIALDLVPEERLGAAFAVSLLLAETREIDRAIECIKTALSFALPSGIQQASEAVEKKLIPLWHLLALLLSSRQDFDTAEQTCLAAFDQFRSPTTLFGQGPGRLRLLQNKGTGQYHAGLVDDMEVNELQRLIEIRLTELALTEVLEGPEHALNSSNDLLTLYSRLFSRLGVSTEAGDKTGSSTIEAPKSSADTIKSFKGSIFGRRKQKYSEYSYNEKANGVPSVINTTRPSTRTTQTPTIHVIDEDEKSSPAKHHLFHHSHEHSHRENRRSLSLRPRSKERNAERPQSYAPSEAQSFETTMEKAPSSTGTTETAQPHLEPIALAEELPATDPAADHDSSPTAKQALKHIPHNLAPHHRVPAPAQHGEQPPEQDVRMPTVHASTSSSLPSPRSSHAAAQKHALVILTKIWLVIATLYRRANMFEDSREACDEASKAALKIETQVANVESSARAFADPGWAGGGKSSDQVWADVYCERAELLLATARLREEKDGEIDSEMVRDAVEQYEQCLMYFADHPRGIVGLSNVLLDYYERKVELGRRLDDGTPKARESVKEEVKKETRPILRTADTTVSNGTLDAMTAAAVRGDTGATDDDLRKTPENLNRLAARDRAYMLLSTLTKLGSGWDDAEAWFALARAHELGGEVDKAREILWWCVELEDTRPIRHWSNLGCGGYVL